MENTLHFTLGKDFGITLTQIAQEHIQYNYDLEKGINTIAKGLIGIPTDMVLKIIKGDYVIEETKAPDGYAKLKNTINKTISVDGNAPQTVNVEEKVTNKTESWLPETGGMGTVIFTVVGVVGVLAILSTYFKKGKKREEA